MDICGYSRVFREMSGDAKGCALGGLHALCLLHSSADGACCQPCYCCCCCCCSCSWNPKLFADANKFDERRRRHLIQNFNRRAHKKLDEKTQQYARQTSARTKKSQAAAGQRISGSNYKDGQGLEIDIRQLTVTSTQREKRGNSSRKYKKCDGNYT